MVALAPFLHVLEAAEFLAAPALVCLSCVRCLDVVSGDIENL